MGRTAELEQEVMNQLNKIRESEMERDNILQEMLQTRDEMIAMKMAHERMIADIYQKTEVEKEIAKSAHEMRNIFKRELEMAKQTEQELRDENFEQRRLIETLEAGKGAASKPK